MSPRRTSWTRTALAWLVGAAAVLALPVPAKAADLGGFTLTASAAPVAIHIFEPIIPIPTEPQLELDLSFSRATLSSGPTGRAVSSLLWPGDGVAYGLPEFLQNPDATYPVKVDASHPGGPATAKQELAPGTGMYADAGEETVQASASVVRPQLPLLPAPGLPVPPMLVAVEAWSSQSTVSVAGDEAVAQAYATAGSVAILGGLVKIDGLHVQTQASSDGIEGSASAKVTWGALTVAGQTFEVNQDGVAGPVGTTPLPPLPSTVVRRLADFGLTIGVPTADTTIEGAGASAVGQGLTITLDTRVLRDKLSLGWLLDPFLALLPPELSNQISPWLDLAPKLSFIVGISSSQANASPPFVAEPPPPPPAGAGGLPPVGGELPGETPPVTATPTTPVAAGRDWPVFGGVPWYLFVLGLGVAAAAAYGLHRFADIVFAAGGCDQGAATGIPNLREQ